MHGTDRGRRPPNPAPAGFVGVALWLGAVLTLAACRSNSFVAAGGAGAIGTPDGRAIPSTVGPKVPKPTVVLEAGGRKVPFRVELAATAAEREKGLTFRKTLTRPTGMLFLFPNEAPQSVSMKNTFVPLDIIFIGSDRRIVGIVENATHETEAPSRVNGSSRYVLEISGGLSSRLGVKAGSEVEFKSMPPGLFPDSAFVQPH